MSLSESHGAKCSQFSDLPSNDEQQVQWMDGVSSAHYRAGDTTSGAADEPHLARDVTY